MYLLNAFKIFSQEITIKIERITLSLQQQDITDITTSVSKGKSFNYKQVRKK